jgi:hypothetical protein
MMQEPRNSQDQNLLWRMLSRMREVAVESDVEPSEAISATVAILCAFSVLLTGQLGLIATPLGRDIFPPLLWGMALLVGGFSQGIFLLLDARHLRRAANLLMVGLWSGLAMEYALLVPAALATYFASGFAFLCMWAFWRVGK